MTLFAAYCKKSLSWLTKITVALNFWIASAKAFRDSISKWLVGSSKINTLPSLYIFANISLVLSPPLFLLKNI